MTARTTIPSSVRTASLLTPHACCSAAPDELGAAAPMREPTSSLARVRTSVALARSPEAEEPSAPSDAPDDMVQSRTIEFLTIRDVESAVKLKKSAIYARIARQAFPPPVKLSSTVSVWIASEVRDWMQHTALRRGER